MIIAAKEINPRKFPRPKGPASRLGLAFQKKFTKALESGVSLDGDVGVKVEPWFEYTELPTVGNPRTAICSPDLLVLDVENGFITVIEIKLTYTPLALIKLRNIYCPVVSLALGLPTLPLVVCKNLTPTSPKPHLSFYDAIRSKEPLFHWIGRGTILWQAPNQPLQPPRTLLTG